MSPAQSAPVVSKTHFDIGYTELLDLEDLTRGYVYSVELARLAGQPLSTGVKMTDVPSHAGAVAGREVSFATMPSGVGRQKMRSADSGWYYFLCNPASPTDQPKKLSATDTNHPGRPL